VRASTTARSLLLLLVAVSLPTVAMPPQEGASGLDGSCRTCHTPSEGYNGVSVGASITIMGVPQEFEPGHGYNITVVIDRGLGPQPSYDILHAFQLGVTDGTLEVADPGTVQVSEMEVGSYGASETDRWSFVWTAPHSKEDVAFRAEGVVGNGDGTEEGDVRLSTDGISYAPPDVHPDESPLPWSNVWVIVISVVAVTGLVGYLIVWTHRPPPSRTID
jgi:hypothetical protein